MEVDAAAIDFWCSKAGGAMLSIAYGLTFDVQRLPVDQ